MTSEQAAMMCVRDGCEDHTGEKNEDGVVEEIRIDDQNRSNDDMDRTGLPFSVDHVDGADRSEEQAKKERHRVHQRNAAVLGGWPGGVSPPIMNRRSIKRVTMSRNKLPVLFAILCITSSSLVAGEASDEDRASRNGRVRFQGDWI